MVNVSFVISARRKQTDTQSNTKTETQSPSKTDSDNPDFDDPNKIYCICQKPWHRRLVSHVTVTHVTVTLHVTVTSHVTVTHVSVTSHVKG